MTRSEEQARIGGAHREGRAHVRKTVESVYRTSCP